MVANDYPGHIIFVRGSYFPESPVYLSRDCTPSLRARSTIMNQQIRIGKLHQNDLTLRCSLTCELLQYGFILTVESGKHQIFVLNVLFHKDVEDRFLDISSWQMDRTLILGDADKR